LRRSPGIDARAGFQGSPSAEAVETFQVLNDTLPEATGTAERLRRRARRRQGPCLNGQVSAALVFETFLSPIAVSVPGEPMGVDGLLIRRGRWSLKPFEETFRGPRGLWKGVV